MEDAIYVLTRDELTKAEIDILIEALSTYHDVLESEGSKRKAETLISAAEKLGLYTED
ncbi:MAG: hypothetical protein OHK0037_35430 [Elainellaceae cyanobacterium]